MKRSLVAVLFGASLLLCHRPERAAAEPLVVGALAELTGSFSSLGEDCRRGYQVAESAHGDGAVVRYGDNRNDPKTAISEYRRLVESENASVIVTTRSPVGLALNPLSARQKVPLIGVVGHPEFLSGNPYAVRIFPSSSDEASALASYLLETNVGPIALVSLEDDYFLSLSNQLAARLGEKVVLAERVLPSEQDLTPLATKISARSPSAVFVNLGPGQIVHFVNKLRDLGSALPVYSNFLAGGADVRKALGERADGIVFAELDYEKPGFLAELKRKTGASETSPIGYACYVALSYALQLGRTSTGTAPPTGDPGSTLREIATLDGAIPLAERAAKLSVVTKKIVRGGTEVVSAGQAPGGEKKSRRSL